MREYVAAYDEYREKFRQWRDDFMRVGTRPAAPEVPYYLGVWMELQRWTGHLLIDGGLWDQPSWTWEMTDYAGMVYQAVVKEGKDVG